MQNCFFFLPHCVMFAVRGSRNPLQTASLICLIFALEVSGKLEKIAYDDLELAVMCNFVQFGNDNAHRQISAALATVKSLGLVSATTSFSGGTIFRLTQKGVDLFEEATLEMKQAIEREGFLGISNYCPCLAPTALTEPDAHSCTYAPVRASPRLPARAYRDFLGEREAERSEATELEKGYKREEGGTIGGMVGRVQRGEEGGEKGGNLEKVGEEEEKRENLVKLGTQNALMTVTCSNSPNVTSMLPDTLATAINRNAMGKLAKDLEDFYDLFETYIWKPHPRRVSSRRQCLLTCSTMPAEGFILLCNTIGFWIEKWRNMKDNGEENYIPHPLTFLRRIKDNDQYGERPAKEKPLPPMPTVESKRTTKVFVPKEKESTKDMPVEEDDLSFLDDLV